MNTRKMTMQLAIAAMLFIGTACTGGNKKNTEKNEVTSEQTATAALQVDDVLAQAPTLANKEIKLEGVCTHTCAHGATKIFLMGSDDTKTIRVEAGKLGSFDKKCVNSIVTVDGILKEERIDEAFLQQWEAQLKEQKADNHGENGQGCSTEKKARGEKATTPEGRIADFRQKIKEREAKEGKAYLSFYFVEANSYAIQ